MVKNEEREHNITNDILHYRITDSGAWYHTQYQIRAWCVTDYFSGLQLCDNLEPEFWKYDFCIICDFCNNRDNFTYLNE